MSLLRAGDLPVMTGSARYEVSLLRAGECSVGNDEVPLLRAPTSTAGSEAEIPECRFRMLRVTNATVG
ncbi:hypothetical protein CYJ40_10280 [Brevibacterium ravenspurgense]|uniref:Uncharacterized protein n=1 Tax=Brevibacterium ravenspurgense TaxID=479117 RepID=A0A2I1IEF2_9MICO|nr:hypothetical protein CYJ40_10280 [Brevibacterium ravenspurgense]